MGQGVGFSRRKRIIDTLVDELQRIDGEADGRAEFNYITNRNGYTYKTNVFNNVFRSMKYLNEIY